MKQLSILLCLLVATACQPNITIEESEEDKEAREDAEELARAYELQAQIPWRVHPSMETKHILARSEEDAADDPAIWVHPEFPQKSLIYGSNKQGGLAAYNLQGEEIAYYPIGKINNVDVLYDFPMGDSLVTLVGCTNRTEQSINLFRIDPRDGSLHTVLRENYYTDTTVVDDIYGFCFGHDRNTGLTYTFINGKNGLLQQYEMGQDATGVTLKLVRSVQFDSQTEGMVADDELGYLYVGEEGAGIWKLTIDPSNPSRTHIAQSDERNPHITYDVEGLTLYKDGLEGLLIASSQGNFSYALFERGDDNTYLGSFVIASTEDIDGAEETDGLDVVGDSLSARFPAGILVVQDGFNHAGDSLLPQNFKYVDLREVLRLLE